MKTIYLVEDVEKAKKGDKQAFTRLIKGMEAYLYKVSFSMMGSDQESLDATQETLVKAYLSLHTLKEPQYFKTWITRILIRECSRLLRAKQKVVSLHGGVEEAFSNVNKEDHMDLKEAINKLDEDIREVVLLYYIQDLPLKEVAAIIEQPEGTIKSKLSRARKKLAGYLGKDYQMGGMLHEQI